MKISLMDGFSTELKSERIIALSEKAHRLYQKLKEGAPEEPEDLVSGVKYNVVYMLGDSNE